MSLQIEIIRAVEFIRVGPEGQFDLVASKAALATLAAACRKRGVNNAVLDLRALQPGPKPVFTTSDLVELVNTFPEAGFTKRLRLAILYRSDPHKRARLFAFVSALHGWKVGAFGDFERAMLWLSSGQEISAQPPQGPLRQATRGPKNATGAQDTDCSARNQSGRVSVIRGRAGTKLHTP